MFSKQELTNKEKFLKLVSPEPSRTMENVRWRIANRPMLRRNEEIALKVLEQLDVLGITSKELGEKIGNPDEVSKLLHGKLREDVSPDLKEKLERELLINL